MRLVVQAVGPRIDAYFDRPWAPGETPGTQLVVIGPKGLNRQAIAQAIVSATPSRTPSASDLPHKGGGIGGALPPFVHEDEGTGDGATQSPSPHAGRVALVGEGRGGGLRGGSQVEGVPVKPC
jgi:hypothetical protein